MDGKNNSYLTPLFVNSRQEIDNGVLHIFVWMVTFSKTRLFYVHTQKIYILIFIILTMCKKSQIQINISPTFQTTKTNYSQLLLIQNQVWLLFYCCAVLWTFNWWLVEINYWLKVAFLLKILVISLTLGDSTQERSDWTSKNSRKCNFEISWVF